MERPFDPAAALIAYHAALDSQDMDRLARMFAVDATYESAGLGLVTGRAAILDAVRNYFATSPDHQAWDDVVKATGPREAMCQWRLRATNKVTGKKVERTGTEVVAFNKAGQITRVAVKDD